MNSLAYAHSCSILRRNQMFFFCLSTKVWPTQQGIQRYHCSRSIAEWCRCDRSSHTDERQARRLLTVRWERNMTGTSEHSNEHLIKGSKDRTEHDRSSLHGHSTFRKEKKKHSKSITYRPVWPATHCAITAIFDTLALSYVYCFSFKSLAFIHKLSLTTTKEHILIHDRESV